MEKGIADMTAGPHAESIYNMMVLMTFTTPFGGDFNTQSIDNFVDDLFAGIRQNVNNLNTSPTVRDFATNSTYIAGLTSYTPRVPIVNIVCEENSKAALRLGNGMLLAPENAQLHQYSDNALIEVADKLREVYKGFRIYHDVQKFAQPWRYSHHNTLANKWQRGEKYLESVHEVDYNMLLGTTRLIPTTKTVQVRVCANDCGTSSVGREACSIPENCWYEWRTITTYISETTLSDGLLPSWAQKLRNVAPGDFYIANGVSHAEASNHPNVFQRYIDVFDRADRFRIQIRQ